MSQTDARLLCHYLRMRGYVAELSYHTDTGRWHVVATKLRRRP